MMGKVVSVIIGLMVVSGAIVLWFWINSRKIVVDEIKISIPFVPTPTSMPFSEMTIPNLRARQYSSNLNGLEPVSENSSYSSYLTSYDSDGLKINGQITIPKSGGPRHPAIVFVHGYIPPTSYRTLINYASYVDFLAKNGFVVLKIDLRGHDKSEGEPGGAYYSEDYVVDTINAVSALKQADFVDSEGIGLWGHSMAGNVVFRSFVAQDIPAVVIWAGAGFSYSDFQTYGVDDNSYRPPADDSKRQRRRQMLFDTHGQFNPDSIFWQQVAPTNYLTGIQGAIQLHHAANDAVVNVGYSRDLVQILQKNNIVHEFYEYATGGHNLTGASFTSAMQRSVEFFNVHLQN